MSEKLKTDFLEGQSPKERARRAIKFALNPFVGRNDMVKIKHHIGALDLSTSLMRKMGEDPTSLINELEQISRDNGGTPPHKEKVTAAIINIIMKQRDNR